MRAYARKDPTKKTASARPKIGHRKAGYAISELSLFVNEQHWWLSRARVRNTSPPTCWPKSGIARSETAGESPAPEWRCETYGRDSSARFHSKRRVPRLFNWTNYDSMGRGSLFNLPAALRMNFSLNVQPPKCVFQLRKCTMHFFWQQMRFS